MLLLYFKILSTMGVSLEKERLFFNQLLAAPRSTLALNDMVNKKPRHLKLYYCTPT